MPKKDKSLTEKVKIKIDKDTEESLRFAIIENFFNNYSLNTWRIYKVNFFRGLFFDVNRSYSFEKQSFRPVGFFPEQFQLFH